jgi:hypothetical protein
MTTSSLPCPRCGANASGRYCSACGAPLGEARCPSCGATLTPGARFCHGCGAAVGAPNSAAPDPGKATKVLPWAVAGVALIALIALMIGQQAGSAPTATAPGVAGAPFASGAGGAPPDISSMTPRERADRLYDRVMRLDAEGKRDSVQLFATMAVQAYQMIPEMDLDARYDMGRIAELANQTDVATAQADTILRESPTHLLGLMLAESVASRAGNDARAREMRRRLVAAADAERRKNLPEYERHQREIDRALDAARAAR